MNPLIYPGHPLISSICPILSFVAFCAGFVMLVLAIVFRFGWARKGANIGGLGMFLPLVVGVGLMYGKHWEIGAMVPVVAISSDGRCFRDGCKLEPGTLEEHEAKYPPAFFYRWYAVIIAIVAVGTIWDRSEKRGMAKIEAEHAEQLARRAGTGARRGGWRRSKPSTPNSSRGVPRGGRANE